VAINAGSIVKLFSALWQVPQVRPLPPKVSLKNIFRPLAISASCGDGTFLELKQEAMHQQLITRRLVIKICKRVMQLKIFSVKKRYSLKIESVLSL